jgi:hypothetical protein
VHYLSLFDELDHTDPSPAHYSEGSFAFLNRIATPFWDRVRRELDSWYGEFPDEDGDLRARFRRSEANQHYAAWWELYLHRLFTRLGFHAEVHPNMGEDAGHPDFLLTRGDTVLYLEASTVFSGIVEQGRRGALEAGVMDAINAIEHPNWFVMLDFDAVGAQAPPREAITKPITNWLDTLDPDDVADALRRGAPPPEFRYRVRDWDLRLRAMPVRPSARGKPGHRLLAAGPPSGGVVNDRQQLGKSLRRKRRRYGQPDHPFVVAVLSLSAFMDDEDIADTLFGSASYRFAPDAPESGSWVRNKDGFWYGLGGPVGTRVSGLLIAKNLQPHNCAREWPRLWHHPHAAHPLLTNLPFPQAHLTDSALTMSDASKRPNEVLDLPVEWPGPDSPFPDDA